MPHMKLAKNQNTTPKEELALDRHPNVQLAVFYKEVFQLDRRIIGYLPRLL